MPSARVRELETLLAHIRYVSNVLQAVGGSLALGGHGAEMEYELSQTADEAHEKMKAARAALLALVTATRADAPDEITAWADAHEMYLAGFLADLAARGKADTWEARAATEERAAWAEVRAGSRAFVDEKLYWIDVERYVALFGCDPRTRIPLT